MTAPRARSYGRIQMIDGPATVSQFEGMTVMSFHEPHPTEGPLPTVEWANEDGTVTTYHLWHVVDNRGGAPVDHWFYSVMDPEFYGQEQPSAERQLAAIEAKLAEWRERDAARTTVVNVDGDVVRTDQNEDNL